MLFSLEKVEPFGTSSRSTRISDTPDVSVWIDRFCEAGASFELARAAIDHWSLSRAKILLVEAVLCFRWAPTRMVGGRYADATTSD